MRDNENKKRLNLFEFPLFTENGQFRVDLQTDATLH